MTIELIQPEYIVTLGRIALDSLQSITPHSITMREDVGKMHRWGKYNLIPFYHPGPRALIHRPLDLQKEDYAILANLINGSNVNTSNTSLTSRKSYTKFEKVIINILAQLKEITFFKLTKLLYLYDYKSIVNNGHSITNEVYLREANGPWMPNLRLVVNDLDQSLINIRFVQKIPVVKIKTDDLTGFNLSEDEINLLSEILGKYGHLNDSELKTKVYLTSPMRYILGQEKNGKKMKNQAVIYKSKTILDKIEVNDTPDLFTEIENSQVKIIRKKKNNSTPPKQNGVL